MESKKHLIIIGGATATGKTDLAIALARHFRTEIVSADSRQFYREMSIGTAKPSAEELAAAKHHFINSRSISENYSVGDFEKDALEVLEAIFQKNETAILAGGSGLYIRAVCEGLDDFPPVPTDTLEALKGKLDSGGIEALQAELASADPEYFDRVDRNNPHRLIRALAVIRASSRPFSSFRTQKKAVRPFHPIYILLDLEREELYQKINRRVDEMIASGLVEEARQLYPDRHLNALQTVGYQELFEYFGGEISLEEAIEKIKQNSRRYAKRQVTWFRKDPHWQRFRPGDNALIINYIGKVLSEGS